MSSNGVLYGQKLAYPVLRPISLNIVRRRLELVTRLFVGVDIAGAENTWVAGITPTSDGLDIAFGPKLLSLDRLLAITAAQSVASVAIDGQLSLALSDENGFRSSDVELRSLLPTDCRNWVASSNSLMAVPVRARLLADALAPTVGTILETHPRACLLLELGHAFLPDIKEYKRSADSLSRLLGAWIERFAISRGVTAATDGALDSLVCATVAFAYHRLPDRLRHLRHSAADRTGRGPFYVFCPGPTVPAGA